MAPPKVPRDTDEESVGLNSRVFPNDLLSVIDTLRPDDYGEMLYDGIVEKLTNLNEYINELIKGKKQFGKAVRNELTNNYIDFFLTNLKDLYIKNFEADNTIYELKDTIIKREDCLSRVKIVTLERENAELKGKLEALEEVKLLNPLSNTGELLENLTSLKEEVSSLLKTYKDETDQLLVERVVKPSEDLKVEMTRSYAKVAETFRNQPQKEPPRAPSRETESVLLIRPSGEGFGNSDANRKIIAEALAEASPGLRIRAIAPLARGVVKVVSSTEDESAAIRDVLSNIRDGELKRDFDFVIPGKRSPQIILYNIDRSVEGGSLGAGLREKNIFLDDSNNRPLFKVEFSIPAKNKNFNHWVLTVSPVIYGQLTKRNGLYFQFNRLKFREFLSVRQCGTCLSFGHTTKNCDTPSKPRCGSCGGGQK